MDREYYLAVFDSKNHAIYVHQYLKRMGAGGYELVSTPCKIKSGCSYSIKFNRPEDHVEMKNVAASINKKIAGFYLIKYSYGRRMIEKIEF